MCLYWKPLQWAFKGFFILSTLNFNFFVNSQKYSYSITFFFLLTFKSLRNYLYLLFENC